MYFAVTKQNEKQSYSSIICFSSSFYMVHVEGGGFYILRSPKSEVL